MLIRNVLIITTTFSTDKPLLQELLALQTHEFPLLNLAFPGLFHGDKFHEGTFLDLIRRLTRLSPWPELKFKSPSALDVLLS